MKLKWFVQSGTETFGPWSSARIREELRSGGIDPFDLAYVHGSSIKRALIEIDDLFESSSVQAAKIIREEPRGNIATVNSREAHENNSIQPFSPTKYEVNASDFQDEVFIRPSKQGKKGPNLPPSQIPEVSVSSIEAINNASNKVTVAAEKPRVFEALASPDRVSIPVATNAVRVQNARPPSNHPPGSVKRYFIIIPGIKAQGPFNSRDVLALWYAKKLPLNTLVQRNGGHKRIDIRRFVQFYERSQPSGVAFIGEANWGGSSDKSLMWLLLALVVAIGIIAGALVWKGMKTAKDEVIILGSGSLKQGGYSQPYVSDVPSSGAPYTSSMERQNVVTKNNVVTKKPTGIKKQKPAKVPRAQVKVSSSSAQRYNSASTRNGVSNSNRYRSGPKPLPVKKSPISIQPVAPTRSAVRSSGFKDGETVTLSGYKFNAAAVAACSAKCKIPMSGPKGNVTTVFFKEAYGNAVAGKSASLTFTGTVRLDPSSGGVSILLKSVP